MLARLQQQQLQEMQNAALMKAQAAQMATQATGLGVNMRVSAGTMSQAGAMGQAGALNPGVRPSGSGGTDGLGNVDPNELHAAIARLQQEAGGQ